MRIRYAAPDAAQCAGYAKAQRCHTASVRTRLIETFSIEIRAIGFKTHFLKSHFVPLARCVTHSAAQLHVGAALFVGCR